MQDWIQDNGVVVPCELGGNNHGCLGLTMKGACCTSAEKYHSVGYEDLGPTSTAPEDATKYQVTYSKEQCKRKIYLFKEKRCAKIHLKKQLINAFDETCLLDLKEDHIGWNNATIQDVFVHLHEYYSKITFSDLLENKANMTKEYDSETPIQMFYK